ncbi:MAG: hypothetical protein CMJ12_05290 [Pelagibacterales bacterium]|mgnify:CR=1 FL=1|nr:hypothetical protein [Pelagibacterales bacterium]PPR16287.1 MAG: hypothetical protein CFH33_00847 [Alphaproteobacteria bacterium MarineAlpha9_Bin3]|tara:strand:+ start:26578 stop:26757 length:180 start_codon:yes stop_codon:yes gene_type:complete
MHDNNDEINFQIRKFLKQVGVGSHQIIEKELIEKSDCKVSLSLEINNKEIKKFKTTIKK